MRGGARASQGGEHGDDAVEGDTDALQLLLLDRPEGLKQIERSGAFGRGAAGDAEDAALSGLLNSPAASAMFSGTENAARFVCAARSAKPRGVRSSPAYTSATVRTDTWYTSSRSWSNRAICPARARSIRSRPES